MTDNDFLAALAIEALDEPRPTGMMELHAIAAARLNATIQDLVAQNERESAFWQAKLAVEETRSRHLGMILFGAGLLCMYLMAR